MGILQIILRNLEHKPRTRRINDPVPYPEGYRGMLLYEADKCIDCEICSYVCSPAAITLCGNGGREPVTWRYFAEQCTFCGRCVDCCPTGALSFERSAPPVTSDRSRHRTVRRIVYRTCPRCGKRVLPLPGGVLGRHYGDPLPVKIAELSRLCADCRRREVAERLKQFFGRR